MSRILVVLLALLCLCGCGGGEPSVGLANPMEQMETLEAINAKIGCAMHPPEGFSTENESFYVINTQPNVGQYRFDADGITYTLRAAATKEDISGIYLTDGTFGQVADQTGSDTLTFDEGQCTRWFVGGMQYTLHSSCTDPNTDALLKMREALQ